MVWAPWMKWCSNAVPKVTCPAALYASRCPFSMGSSNSNAMPSRIVYSISGAHSIPCRSGLRRTRPRGSGAPFTRLVFRPNGIRPSVFTSASPRLAPSGRTRSNTIGSGIRGPFSSPDTRSIVSTSSGSSDHRRDRDLVSYAPPRVWSGGRRVHQRPEVSIRLVEPARSGRGKMGP